MKHKKIIAGLLVLAILVVGSIIEAWFIHNQGDYVLGRQFTLTQPGKLVKISNTNLQVGIKAFHAVTCPAGVTNCETSGRYVDLTYEVDGRSMVHGKQIDDDTLFTDYGYIVKRIATDNKTYIKLSIHKAGLDELN